MSQPRSFGLTSCVAGRGTGLGLRMTILTDDPACKCISTWRWGGNTMRMSVAVVGSRGRLVLPREVREALRLAEGDTVFFLLDGEQVRLARSPEDYDEYISLYGGGKPDWSEME